MRIFYIREEEKTYAYAWEICLLINILIFVTKNQRYIFQISVICRLIPSPDWFVGVDSLDLCVDASWVDQITLDVRFHLNADENDDKNM